MKNRNSKKPIDLNREVKIRLPEDYPWKVLRHLISDLGHLLTDSEHERLSLITRKRDYDAYLLLSEEWGPQGTYLIGKSLAQVRALRQVTDLLKKYRFPSNNAARRTTAKEKFLSAESSCASFNLNWSENMLVEGDAETLQCFAAAGRFLRRLLGNILPSFRELTEWSRHGPGANLDTKFRRISKYFKYSEWPYSCTEQASPVARAAIRDDERWLGALEDDYRLRNNIPKHMILDQEAFWSSVINIVPGNRITFVPKNALTDRSIAIEPALNLYLQLGVDGYIRRRLKRWGIDLDSQEKNRELARLGSRDWELTNSFVTLDLASASDTISLEICRLLLPPVWYDYFLKLRSPCGELDGEIISYEKISSMGNGFTFALETAIFASLVYGARKVRLRESNLNDAAVYGDDIIVTKDVSQLVVKLLNLSGFQVNETKSHFCGPFRESCGADWFAGKPVRPVYFTTLPTNVMELWTDLNRLRRILSLRFWSEESSVESFLIPYIPRRFQGITGPDSDESFDSYRHVSTPTGEYRYCLWRYKRLVVRPRPVSGPNFLFRKLMHDLRGGPEPVITHTSSTYDRLRVTGSGSRFTVILPSKIAVGYSYSVADIWRSGYSEL